MNHDQLLPAALLIILLVRICRLGVLPNAERPSFLELLGISLIGVEALYESKPLTLVPLTLWAIWITSEWISSPRRYLTKDVWKDEIASELRNSDARIEYAKARLSLGSTLIGAIPGGALALIGGLAIAKPSETSFSQIELYIVNFCIVVALISISGIYIHKQAARILDSAFTARSSTGTKNAQD